MAGKEAPVLHEGRPAAHQTWPHPATACPMKCNCEPASSTRAVRHSECHERTPSSRGVRALLALQHLPQLYLRRARNLCTPPPLTAGLCRRTPPNVTRYSPGPWSTALPAPHRGKREGRAVTRVCSAMHAGLALQTRLNHQGRQSCLHRPSMPIQFFCLHRDKHIAPLQQQHRRIGPAWTPAMHPTSPLNPAYAFAHNCRPHSSHNRAPDCVCSPLASSCAWPSFPPLYALLSAATASWPPSADPPHHPLYLRM